MYRWSSRGSLSIIVDLDGAEDWHRKSRCARLPPDVDARVPGSCVEEECSGEKLGGARERLYGVEKYFFPVRHIAPQG